MEVRPPAPHELEAYADCVEAAFGTRLSTAERGRLGEGLNPACLAAFEKGELVGTFGAYESELTLPGGVTAPALVLDDVAVLPTHRRRGVLSTMIAAGLDCWRRDGPALVALSASEGGIYGRFGFAPCCFAARYRLDPARAVLSGRVAAAPGEVRLLRPAEALEAFPEVHAVARRRRPGELRRSAASWQEMLVPGSGSGAGSGSGSGAGSGSGSGSGAGLVPAATAADRAGALRLLAAYEVGGSIDGYAVYDLVAEGGSARHLRLEIAELVATSLDAYLALWSYLLGTDLCATVTTRLRPLDEPLRHLLEDPRALETLAVSDQLWLRLVDPLAALAARRYATEGALGLEIDDPAASEPVRLLLVADSSGRGEASTPAAGWAARTPTIALDAATLAAAYLGTTSISTLAGAGLVAERRPGALELADRIFGHGPSPYCTAEA